MLMNIVFIFCVSMNYWIVYFVNISILQNNIINSLTFYDKTDIFHAIISVFRLINTSFIVEVSKLCIGINIGSAERLL